MLVFLSYSMRMRRIIAILSDISIALSPSRQKIHQRMINKLGKKRKGERPLKSNLNYVFIYIHEQLPIIGSGTIIYISYRQKRQRMPFHHRLSMISQAFLNLLLEIIHITPIVSAVRSNFGDSSCEA